MNGDGASAPRAPGGRPPEPPVVSWRRAVRDVAMAAVLVVTLVLGAAILTSVLPEPLQRVVFHTPLAIVLLVGVTTWVLWRVATRRPAGD